MNFHLLSRPQRDSVIPLTLFRNWLAGIAFWVAILILGTNSHSVLAAHCPFCPPSQPTYAEHLANSDVAILVQWKGQKVHSEQEATTTFEILDLLKGDPKEWKKGGEVSVPYARDGQPGDLLLLMGQADASPKEKNTNWLLVQEVNEVLYGYIRKAPPLEEKNTRRLEFYWQGLESLDPEIGNDAFAEFSRATYADVASIKTVYQPEKLRQWLQSKQVLPVRKGLYAMMLGLVGNREDATWMLEEILRPVEPQETRLGIDGMMAGFVLLEGQTGLEKICHAKLDNPQTSPAELYATVNLLRFLWEENPLHLPPEILRNQLRKLLTHKELGEVALVDLARWKDWGAWPMIQAHWGQNAFSNTTGKQKIIQFAQTMLKDQNWGDPQSRQAVQDFIDRNPLPKSPFLPLPTP